MCATYYVGIAWTLLGNDPLCGYYPLRFIFLGGQNSVLGNGGHMQPIEFQLIDPDEPPPPPECGWRTSSHSNPSGNCVELGMVPGRDRPSPARAPEAGTSPPGH